MPRGLIFNIQRYSLQDGPGIRTTVFLKGCPLRCAWCHNPEGISSRRELVVTSSLCANCGECRRACATTKAARGHGMLPPRSEECDLCGACVEACPAAARQIVGREITVPDLLAAVTRDRVFYDDSHGGVTFSGGEPLAQPEFVEAALAACRAQGIATAVDTCGLAPIERLLAIAPLTDVFLYDLKFMDDAKHRQYTGTSNRLILDNLVALGRHHNQITVRVPVIPGLNDDPAELETAARFVTTVPGVCEVNLLPFHPTGLPKLERLGRACSLPGLRAPSSEAMRTAVWIFSKYGLAAKAGG